MTAKDMKNTKNKSEVPGTTSCSSWYK